MMTKRYCLLCLLLACALLASVGGLLVLDSKRAQAAAQVHYVAPGAACGSASPCYSSLQAAVDAALAGDEIRVAAGSYSGVNNQGGKPQVVYVAKDLTLRGGYTSANWTTPDPETNLTEINAQTLGRVLFVAENANLSVDGFHLVYGNATGLGGHTTIYGTRDAGGGVYVYSGTLTLSNAQLLHNSTPKGGLGGGLYARESVVNISQVRFEDNSSDGGSGAYLFLAGSSVQASEFVANQLYSMNSTGAAIHVEEGSLFFYDNWVEANVNPAGSLFGGALYLNEAQFAISGNQILGSSGGSKYDGGASLDYSTGVFSGNYVANHRNIGLAVLGGYVEAIGNEIAYNQGQAPLGGAGVTFSPNPLYDSRFTLSGNYIHHNTDNYSEASGGGARISTRIDNPAYLYHNIIQDNMAADGSVLSEFGVGGGVHVSGDYATLEGNIIQRNLARGYVHVVGGNYGGFGGGVYIAGNATLTNNIITDNQARFGGSGVYVTGSSPYLYHNTIANNLYAGEDGSGVWAAESVANVPGQPRLYNNIITNQLVGVFADKGDVSSVILIENVLWYANAQDTGGGGAVFVNHPRSGDPLYADAAGYNYLIGPGSAAIDGGAVTIVLRDIHSEPRFGLPDLGADEYWAPGALQRVFSPVVVK
jgi:hypothetical protein